MQKIEVFKDSYLYILSVFGLNLLCNKDANTEKKRHGKNPIHYMYNLHG